jgi:VWFA-related protein
MNRIWTAFLFAAAALPQHITHEVRVINIEVPVRVFEGERFVDHLKLDDFEVLEDGVPQKLEAVYLVRKTAVERGEAKSAALDEKPAFKPETARYFYLLFSLYEYNAKIPEALTYFFKNVLKPDDHLFIITPRSVYDMKKEAIGKVTLEKTVERLTKILRKDIQLGDAAYRAVLTDLKRMAAIGGIEKATGDKTFEGEDEFTAYGAGGMDEYFQKYRSDVETLEGLRAIDQNKLVKFADSLKKITGRKIVYLFYQKEFVPVLSKNFLATLENSVTLKPLINDLFEMFNRAARIDIGRIKEAFSDPTISVYFSYLTKLTSDLSISQVAEHSEDVFNSFDEIAKATGGATSSSTNPEYLMRQASQAAENYYLLYYSPKDKSTDGKFRTVTVRVKTGNYRLTHLAGYFAK